MEYVIYKTTNLINGKFYLGKSSIGNINRGYMGSGSRIKAAIKKYGKENFKVEILHTCKTEQEAYDLERKIITEACCSDPNCYNIQEGGLGGTAGMAVLHKGSVNIKAFPEDVEKLQLEGWKIGFSSERNLNVSKSVKGKPKSVEHIKTIQQTIHSKLPELKRIHEGRGKGDVFLEKDGHVIRVPGVDKQLWEDRGYVPWRRPYSKETREKMSKSHKGKPGTMKGRHHSEETRKKLSEAGKGRVHSEEWKQKVSAALKGHEGYWKGKESPNKGRIMSEESRRKMSEAHKGKPAWNKGMTGSGAGTVWMNKDGVNKRIKPDQLQRFENDGWFVGKIRRLH